ncbi:hypothetical protein HHX47_DHR5000479 [Lentinula edodes]|nr:hypothetical protein HHX47_DHR5000479 [Lentinula edodes]
MGNDAMIGPPPPKGKEEDKKKRMHKQVQEHKTKLKILGTEEGIEALTEFLEESGAFTKTGKQRPIAEAPTYTPLGIGEELEAMFHGPTGEEMTPEADWREEVIDSDNSDTEI